MRAIAGIIAVATVGMVGMVACSGSTTAERQAVTQDAQQAHADVVSVLTVEGMT